jgi:ribosomal protein S18 acetylase RimI-like enzyme
VERESDGPFLFALFAAAQCDCLAALDPALRHALLHHQFIGRDAAYRAAYGSARFEVVEVSGEPAARLVTHLSTQALTLVDLAVSPARQGCGIGTALLGALQAEARSVGVPLRLSVVRTNAGARRLYRRLGFMPVGETETHLDLRWTS